MIPPDVSVRAAHPFATDILARRRPRERMRSSMVHRLHIRTLAQRAAQARGTGAQRHPSAAHTRTQGRLSSAHHLHAEGTIGSARPPSPTHDRADSACYFFLPFLLGAGPAAFLNSSLNDENMPRVRPSCLPSARAPLPTTTEPFSIASAPFSSSVSAPC